LCSGCDFFISARTPAIMIAFVCCFSSIPPRKLRYNTLITSRPLPYKSFPVHPSHVSDDMYSDVQTAEKVTR
jgi:hypothetical protein